VVSRWPPDAQGRLERAALELFVEQGFAETTVPQITARAGLTTRTFFRYFADKREVLFGTEEELLALVARVFAEAPASLSPLMLIAEGLGTVAVAQFEGQREYLRTRRSVIQANESLRERELRKLSVMSEAISRGFLNRGVDELTATLAAQIAITVLSTSVGRWLGQDSERPLSEIVRDTLGTLRSVVTDPAGPALPPAVQLLK
jgi:AcrR family transcriptional regulator